MRSSHPVRGQVFWGIVLGLVGAAALFRLAPAIADYGYAVVWWGVLLVVNAWNWRYAGMSLWREDLRHFLLITAPASVLVWLVFEALNFPAPQWGYRGGLPGVWLKVFFGFVAFATVIPIMVEFWWLLVRRPQCVPAYVVTWFRRNRLLCLALGIIMSVIPFINTIFWFNQGIWLVPGLVLFPFVRSPEPCGSRRFFVALVTSALLAGLAWETLNYPAQTHWQYLILPHAPHLFYMPLPGYIGFIPFAFSMMAVYEFQKHIPARLTTGLTLYAVCFGGLYWLTVLYLERGIWITG